MKFLLFVVFFGLCQANKIPQFVPQGYHLDLYPDVELKIVRGLVVINIATYAEPTNIIQLDADPSVFVHYKSMKLMELSKNSKHSENKTTYEITAVERVLFDQGILRIHVNEKLLRDITYQLHIAFEAPLQNETYNSPFYMTTFMDINNIERKVVVMDLTKNGCYKTFPCFNEPAYKSWIALSVVRKNTFYAFSSAPVNYTISLGQEGKLVKDYFLSTPPLSMKSLALIVSDAELPGLDYHSGEEASRKYDLPNYAVNPEIVRIIIRQLEEHLLIPFPAKYFNSLTFPSYVKVPEINAFGLMIIRDPQDESFYIGKLIYEIFRQWFIHMATPVSQYSAIERIITQLTHRMNAKILEKMNLITKQEFNNHQDEFIKFVLSSEVVHMPLEANSHINGLFVYMMDNLYENKLLNEAMHMLLRKKEFKMYSEEDIWNVLNEASIRLNKEFERPNYENLREVLESWKHIGVLPIVNIIRDYERNEMNITQEPFLFGSNDFKILEIQRNSSSFIPRMIPIILSHPNNLFNKKELLGWTSAMNYSYQMNSMDRYDFIIFNPSHIGFFITNYDETNWNLLMKNFHVLAMPVKLQLLFDSMVLATLGKLDYTYFLNMSLSIETNEQYLSLWFKYIELANYLMNHFHGEVAYKFKEYVYLQSIELLNSIPPSNLNNYPKLTKKLVEEAKKEMKYKMNCLRTKSCFTLWEYEVFMFEVRVGKRLTGEHNCEIIKNVSLPDWEIIANGLFHALQNNATFPIEEVWCLLTCTKNQFAFETLMNLVFLNFNGTSISINEVSQEIVLNNIDPDNHKFLLNFVDKNFAMLKERLSPPIWKKMIEVLILTTKTDDDLKELFNFVNKYNRKFGRADDKVKEGLIIISNTINRNVEVYPGLLNWLEFAIKKFNKVY